MASLPPSQNSSLQAKKFRAMAACPPPPPRQQPLPITNTTSEHHLLLSHPVPLLLDDRSPSCSLPPSTYSQAPCASQMAVLSLGCGSDKENAPPPSAAHGIAVKRQTMKRPGGGSKAPRRRPPLRDITRLFVTAPCSPPSTAVLLALSDAALPEAVAVRPGAGASDGVNVKQGSHALRMGFR